jgi:serine protease Do
MFGSKIEAKTDKKNNKIILGVAATAIIGTVAVLGTIGGLKASTSLSTKASGLTTPVAAVQSVAVPSLPVNIADIVERVNPAVVSIQVTHSAGATQLGRQSSGESPFEEFFEKFFSERDIQRFRHPNQQRSQPQVRPKSMGVGSGFIIDEEGLIVTNNHVIANADEIIVKLSTGKEIKAKLIGSDSKTDLALLKIDAGYKLPHVSFGASENMRVGDWIVTIGNPFGLGQTATTGIISARHRNIGAGPFDDFLQIDAPINKGNSGGPAFNLKGEVIGVNTAIFSPSGGNVGIGFAIPSTQAKKIIADLKDNGAVERGWLGVHIQGVSEQLADSLGLKKAEGALVSRVMADSPAKKAGLQRGDVILEVNDKDVEKLRDLPRLVAALKVDEKAEFTIWRDGKKISVDAKVGKAPRQDQLAKLNTDKQENSNPQSVSGMKLAALDDRARKSLGVEIAEGGVVITDVLPNSAAAATGLHQGDVILSVGNKTVSKPADVTTSIDEARKSDRRAVLLLVMRGANERFVALPLKDA